MGETFAFHGQLFSHPSKPTMHNVIRKPLHNPCFASRCHVTNHNHHHFHRDVKTRRGAEKMMTNTEFHADAWGQGAFPFSIFLVYGKKLMCKSVSTKKWKMPAQNVRSRDNVSTPTETTMGMIIILFLSSGRVAECWNGGLNAWWRARPKCRRIARKFVTPLEGRFYTNMCNLILFWMKSCVEELSSADQPRRQLPPKIVHER